MGFIDEEKINCNVCLLYHHMKETLWCHYKDEMMILLQGQITGSAYNSIISGLQFILKAIDNAGSDLIDASIVATLIEYFQDHRADCIKDAVNLYYEEEHRKKLEAFAEEQVRLTAEAAEQARLAAISASDAADSAEEALRRVDEAMRKAEEAYDRANEAYSEAQSAYWAATSNND